MSAESGFQDPYRTPALPQGRFAPSPGARPGWLTALCVIAIVIGVLGLMNGILGVVGTLFALLFHVVNFALGLFSPAVHALRLHYVELFGTFYSPGGVHYRPLTHWRPALPRESGAA